MSERTNLRCYGYVNRPFSEVRELLHRDPLELLQRATKAASTRARGLVATLRIELAGIELGVDVRPYVKGVSDEEGIAGLPPGTTVDLRWEADRARALFPLMSARLSASPLSSTETQLELEGQYQPPLGIAGSLLNAAVGHRIAEASVHRLFEDVLEQLRQEPTRG
jgi:hypothetical protein